MTAIAPPLVQLQRPTRATDQARQRAGVKREVALTIDGREISVREGTTLLAACREIGA